MRFDRRAVSHGFGMVAGAFALCAYCVGGLRAQEAAAEEDPGFDSIPGVEWVKGPGDGKLGDQAQVAVPAGYRFTGAAGAKRMLELGGNFPSGDELGLLAPENLEWFVIFGWDDIGYVKDSEKADLKADELLESMRRGTEQANEERKKRGWPLMHVEGWAKEPFFNDETKRLEWAIIGRSEPIEGQEAPADPNELRSINYNTRLLGRQGVMSAELVVDPAGLDEALPTFNGLLGGFQFSEGKRYAEYREGDRVAAIGLTALIAGGGLALAAKSGLLQKFWKLIVIGLVAVGAGIKKLFGGRRQA